jgi:hypothetical protein
MTAMLLDELISDQWLAVLVPARERLILPPPLGGQKCPFCGCRLRTLAGSRAKCQSDLRCAALWNNRIGVVDMALG